jgi:cytochrome c
LIQVKRSGAARGIVPVAKTHPVSTEWPGCTLVLQAVRLPTFAARCGSILEDVKMKSMMMLVALTAAALAMSGTASAQEALAKSSGCLNCHSIDTKKMGPAFKDVAAKYKGKADAEGTLVTKLTTANGHPAVKASADDVKSLVKWVLAM